MIDKESYISHINTCISNEIELIIPNTSYSIGCHDEFSYNNDSDIDITVKFFPGTFQNDVLSVSGELLITIKEKMYNDFIEALNEFALDYNEKVVTLGSDTFREYYATPNTIGVLQDRGIQKVVSVSLSFSLNSFTNILGLNAESGVQIKIGSGEYYNIKFLDYLFSFASDINSTGGIGSPIAKQISETCNHNYIISFIPKLDNPVEIALYEHTIEATNLNTKYTLKLTRTAGESETVTPKEIECILISSSIEGTNAGLPLMKITLGRGDF